MLVLGGDWYKGEYSDREGIRLKLIIVSKTFIRVSRSHAKKEKSHATFQI